MAFTKITGAQNIRLGEYWADAPNFNQKGLLENTLTSACMWNIFEER